MGLALLPFVFLWDFVLGRAYLHQQDFAVQWLPWQRFVLESLRRGEAPFWNPYLMLGFSQVGESQVGMFYPVNLLTAFVGLHFRLVLIVCLHLSLASLGTYWLLRFLRIGCGAALVGAISYGLSGYMFAQVSNYVIMQCSAYLPWMILLLTRYLERERWVDLALFSLTAAVNLLISHAGTTFMLLAGVSLFFVAYVVKAKRPLMQLLLYACALFGCLAFAAIQVFPTLELKPLSERGTTLSLHYVTDPNFAAGFEDRLSFFFPWMLGTSRGGHPLRAGYEEVHQYAGAFVPALAAIALARLGTWEERQRRFIASLTVAGVVAFGLSMGGKFPFVNPWVLLLKLPLFGMFRIPARWGCIFTFSLSVLSGFGAQALADCKPRVRSVVALAVGLPALAILAAVLQEGSDALREVFVHPLPVLDAPANVFERWLVAPLSRMSPLVPYAFWALAGSFLYAAYRKQLFGRRRYVASLVALLALDLFVSESPTNPRANQLAFFQSDPVSKFFTGNRRYCRLASEARDANDLKSFPMNVPAYFGIFATGGDTPLELGRYMTLEAELGRAEVLDYLGACYEWTGEGLALREHPQPRAFVVTDVRSPGTLDPLGAFLKLDGKRMRSIVFLAPDALREVTRQVRRRAKPPRQEVTITRFENSRVELDASADAPGLLVLTDMDYPGWSARLDGAETPIFDAQGAFRSVVLPAGSHHVVFVYRARSVFYGALVTAASLGVFVFMAVRERRRSRRTTAA